MSKSKISGSKTVRATHDLSCQSVTTTDLFRNQPIFCREYVPHDSFNVELNQLVRCLPLAVPAFIKVSSRNTWFSCDNSQIWMHWDSFITGSFATVNNVKTQFKKVPTISEKDLRNFFIVGNNGNSPFVEDCSNHPVNWDFVRFDVSDQPTYYRFTPSGLRLYSIFKLLGYSINWNDNIPNMEFSLLPLFAYLNIIVNYYVPAKYRASYTNLTDACYQYSGSNPFLTYTLNSGHLEFAPSCIVALAFPGTDAIGLFSSLLMIPYYSEDYFTSALVNPYLDTVNQASASYLFNASPAASVPAINDPSYTSAGTVNVLGTNSQTSTSKGVSSTGTTEFLLNQLTNVTRYLQRNNVIGSDLAQRLLAQFGIKGHAPSRYARLISSDVVPIPVSDVVSTAETEQASLGENGGRLNGFDSNSCHYEANDYGLLICINSVSCDRTYNQGVSREMLHTTVQDFFQPQFENSGVQAIAYAELFANDTNGVYQLTDIISPYNTFGYTSRYAEYKIPKSTLAGDFISGSRGTGLDAFHCSRFIYPVSSIDQQITWAGLNPVVNAESFSKSQDMPGQDGIMDSQWSRFFADDSSADDHMQQFNYFKVFVKRDMRSLTDYTIGDDDWSSIPTKNLSAIVG